MEPLGVSNARFGYHKKTIKKITEPMLFYGGLMIPLVVGA
jgi:hypothetical protein